jgi:DNA mismatch endonuclease (patch repair protein)
MPDSLKPAVRSRVMASVHSRGNRSTEGVLVVAMRRQGITGWRRHAIISVTRRSGEMTRVRPDFVFRRSRVAVFVDGCFWHACPKHGTIPKTHTAFWRRKLDGNRSRDIVVSRALRDAGWTVLRFWEHETASNIAACLKRIRTAVA